MREYNIYITCLIGNCLISIDSIFSLIFFRKPMTGSHSLPIHTSSAHINSLVIISS